MGRTKEVQQYTDDLAEMEKQLEDISFNSPDYQVLQNQIARTKKALAVAMNSPCPVVQNWVNNESK